MALMLLKLLLLLKLLFGKLTLEMDRFPIFCGGFFATTSANWNRRSLISIFSFSMSWIVLVEGDSTKAISSRRG